MQTVTALYGSYAAATQAISELEAAGVAQDAISVVSGSRENLAAADEDGDSDMEGAATGASLGAVVAGGAGLLAGLGIMAIPGIGPVVAAGWLASTAAGAAVGGVAGGLLGSLADVGVSSDHAQVYAEGVRRGGSLVTVRAQDDQVLKVREILQRHGQIDPDECGLDYRAEGWAGFDEKAMPPSPAARNADLLGRMGPTI